MVGCHQSNDSSGGNLSPPEVSQREAGWEGINFIIYRAIFKEEINERGHKSLTVGIGCNLCNLCNLC